MQCKFKKKHNKTCQSPAMKDSSYCFTHNPETREQHQAAARDGGKLTYNKGLSPLKPIELTDAKSVLYVIADTINRVRRVREDGSMDVKTANCIGFLSGKMLDAQNQILIEERISKLEEALIQNGVIR